MMELQELVLLSCMISYSILNRQCILLWEDRITREKTAFQYHDLFIHDMHACLFFERAGNHLDVEKTNPLLLNLC